MLDKCKKCYEDNKTPDKSDCEKCKMTEEIIIDGKTIGCPCYIDRPLHRYNYGCLIQSQAFSEQQTEEKPILRCDEITNCPIKELYRQLKRLEQENKDLKKQIESDKGLITVGGKQQYEYLQRIDELKLENKELKVVKEQLKKWNDENLKRQDDMQLWIDLAEEQRKKYRSALEEIKKICKEDKEVCLGECGDFNTASRVLDKINEVLTP